MRTVMILLLILILLLPGCSRRKKPRFKKPHRWWPATDMECQEAEDMGWKFGNKPVWYRDWKPGSDPAVIEAIADKEEE